jgi:curved DNA-binding protein
MEYRDYYKIIGVERDATQDAIKRAYRKLARKYHPDVSKEPDAEARFKEVGEAYEVLKDPEKRAAYDQLGANWKAGQEFHAPPDWDAGFEFRGGGFAGGDGSAFSDFFESLFGLEDAWRGATRQITLQLPQVDPQGRLHTRERVLNVRIPAGVRQGQRIRLAGQGASGPGAGPAGDLYLEIEFRPHPFYRVADRDLYLELPVAPWEAALGATAKVPTPAGTVDLKIPAGSGSGRKLRLKGRGIPGQPPGDLYVELKVALPAADNAAAQALYRKMQQELDFNPRAHLGV